MNVIQASWVMLATQLADPIHQHGEFACHPQPAHRQTSQMNAATQGEVAAGSQGWGRRGNSLCFLLEHIST